MGASKLPSLLPRRLIARHAPVLCLLLAFATIVRADGLLITQPSSQRDVVRYAHRQVTIPNALQVPIMLDSFTVAVSGREPIKWSEPHLEAVPFLDYLIVKLRNDGWENFRGASINLLAAPGQFGAEPNWKTMMYSNDIERFRDLLEDRSGIITLAHPVPDHEYFLLKIAAGAEPFGYFCRRQSDRESPLDLPPFLTMSPHHSGEYVRATAVFRAVASTRTYRDKNGKETVMTGGSASPLADIKVDGGAVIEQSLDSTILQLTPLTERSLYVSDMIGSGLRGGVGEPGVFMFGPAKIVAETEQMTERRYGVTVDLRGTDGNIKRTIPIGRLIGPQFASTGPLQPAPPPPPIIGPDDSTDSPKHPPGQNEIQPGPVNFDLIFVTDRPTRFKARATATWHVGSNPPVETVRTDFIAETTFPRPHDTSWNATARVLKQVVAANPEAAKQCRELLRTDIDKISLRTDAESAAIQRRMVDALTLLFYQTSPENLHLMQSFATSVFAHESQGDERGQCCRQIAFQALPILCQIDPEGSANFVLRALVDRDDSRPLGIALCWDNMVQLLLEQRDRLNRPRNARNAPPPHTPGVNDVPRFTYIPLPEFLLNCYLGASDLEEGVRGDSALEKGKRLACIAWAASTGVDPSTKSYLVGIVRRQLRRGDLRLDEGVTMIRALQVGANAELHADVRKYLQRTGKDTSAAAVFYFGLRYLQVIGVTAEDKNLLEELQRYTYRSEVADLARNLLH